ncbi:hypothetical protein [Massilia sp. Mn16-1_5]|uniref:hypothetical protein n=1 Tax=Massilia sp. Mn16-1_5 TaxID=2079199 RepID=UPI00109E8FB6|nr:hypothetical protein [Massilia sp. Mn16-1_5]
MWPLTDTALHLMDAANLASARCNGVELDLERLWRDADPASLHALDASLAAVLAHAWPRPFDPVVLALCYQAEEMRDAVQAQGRKLSGARAPAAPAGVWPCRVP